MVEQKEKKYPKKAILVAVVLAVVVPVVTGLGVIAYEKHVGREVIQERFMSRLENISLEDVGRLYNWCRIDVKVNGGYLLEGIGNLFRGYD